MAEKQYIWKVFPTFEKTFWTDLKFTIAFSINR